MPRSSLGLSLASMLTLACQPDSRDVGDLYGDGSDSDTDGGNAPGDDGSGSDGAGEDGGDDGGDDGDDGIKYDVQGGTGGPGDGEEGCEKVDFLFVIDSSGSMGAHQTQLINSFPGFIAKIQDTLQGQDYHVMVVDSDGQDICDGICDGGAPHCALGGFQCADVPTLSGCDVELGAGNTRDVRKAACAVDGGKRYMTHDQTDLAGTFECVARVGTYGDGNEKPIGAMTAALSDALNGTGGCNDGFLRDDAILVLTFLTDAPPKTAQEQVAGLPSDWYDVVVAAKNGNPNAVGVLGLVSDGDVSGGLCECQAGGCTGDHHEGAPKYREFIELFPRSVLASVCESDYTGFFDGAVDVIDGTCDDFVPEG